MSRAPADRGFPRHSPVLRRWYARRAGRAALDRPLNLIGSLGRDAGMLQDRRDAAGACPAASPRPAESGPAATIGPIPGMRWRSPRAPARQALRGEPPGVNPRCLPRVSHPSARRAPLFVVAPRTPPKSDRGRRPRRAAPGSRRRGRRGGEERENERMGHWRYVTSAPGPDSRTRRSVSRSADRRANDPRRLTEPRRPWMHGERL